MRPEEGGAGGGGRLQLGRAGVNRPDQSTNILTNTVTPDNFKNLKRKVRLLENEPDQLLADC